MTVRPITPALSRKRTSSQTACAGRNTFTGIRVAPLRCKTKPGREIVSARVLRFNITGAARLVDDCLDTLFTGHSRVAETASAGTGIANGE